MQTVLQEYLFYFVQVIAGLGSFSLAYIFYTNYSKFKSAKGQFWRFMGFFTFALAFFLYEWARNNPNIATFAAVAESAGLFYIFMGIFLSRNMLLSDNKNVLSGTEPQVLRLGFWKLSFPIGIFYVIFSFYLTQLENGILFVYICAVVVIIFIIILQVLRFVSNKQNRILNFAAVLSFFFLLVRFFCLIILHLSQDTLIAYLQIQTVDFGNIFYLMMICTAISFLILIFINWRFLVVSFTQRLFVTLVVFSIVMANVTSLFVTVFVVDGIRTNNIDLVNKGVRVQELLFLERGRKAQYFANSMASDQEIIQLINTGNNNKLSDTIHKKISDTGVDEIVVYSGDLEVLVNPVDPREEGALKTFDKYLTYSKDGKRGLLTVDTTSGVLSGDNIIRAIYPVLVDSNVKGIIEVNYKFDNAFADYIKKQTDLDLTIYAYTLRSASTIRAEDAITRWIGSLETDEQVVNKVLKEGVQYENESLVFNSYYFTSYLPLKDIKGEIVGMLSAQLSTDKIIESTRAQTITNFLVITSASLLSALVVYVSIKRSWLQTIQNRFSK